MAHSFAELLADDLDPDARTCYVRTAADIGMVATGCTDARAAGDVVRALLIALVAPPASRGARWGQLYARVSQLVERCDPEAVPPSLSHELAPAIDRLSRFLDENADLAYAMPNDERLGPELGWPPIGRAG